MADDNEESRLLLMEVTAIDPDVAKNLLKVRFITYFAVVDNVDVKTT